MDNVQNLLNEVNAKIQALETAKELYGEQLAPNFLVFDFVNTNETGLSWILACLLDPKGTHGQKTLFLQNFIKICLPNIHNHENKIWQNYLNNLSNTTVETEDTTTASQSYRRMDIYLAAQINDETFGICIENKPYASDQQDQLTDYYKELQNRNLTHKHLVYLSEYGEPSDYSVRSDVLDVWRNEKIFSHVTYTQLVEWLTECKKDCQNQSVTEFLNQFIKFIQKQFMGVEDMNESEQILSVMQSNKDNIANSIKVSLNIYEMKRQLARKLVSQLESKILESGKNYSIRSNQMESLTGNYKEEKIIFVIPNSFYTICLEFGGTWFNSPYLGIYLPEENLNSSDPRYIEIFDNCKESITNFRVKSGGAWIAWYDFQPFDWYSVTEPWEMIETGEMATKIIKEVDVYYEILRTCSQSFQ